MPHAEAICDHVVMMHQGRKVLDDPVRTIRSRFDTGRVVFEPLDPAIDPDSLRTIPGVDRVGHDTGQVELVLADGTESRDVMREVVARYAVDGSRSQIRPRRSSPRRSE